MGEVAYEGLAMGHGGFVPTSATVEFVLREKVKKRGRGTF